MRAEDFQAKIGDIVLEHPIMNAAGTCKHLDMGSDSIKAFAKSCVSAVIIGTVTELYREGNRGKDFYWEKGFALNSAGMSNPGLKYYQENWSLIEKYANEAPNGPKPIFVSIFGFDTCEFVALTSFFINAPGVKCVELNLSCPNILRRGEVETAICYDIFAVQDILSAVEDGVRNGEKMNIAVKLAPFVPSSLFKRVIKTIVKFPMVKAITTCNSFPGAYDCDSDGWPRIHTHSDSDNSDHDNFLGGMSGVALRPIALGQVVQIRDILDELDSDIKVIGVGGIRDGLDVRKFLKAGASIVQVGSAFLENPDLKVFDEIFKHFIEISEANDMKNSGFMS